MAQNLLLVDDEPHVLSSLKRLLRRDNYTIFTAQSGDEALHIINEHAIDVVLSDYKMPAMSGAEFLKQVRMQSPDTFRLMLSGHSDFDQVMKAINEDSIYGFSHKPWDDDDLRNTVSEAFKTQKFLSCLRQSKDQENRFFRLTCTRKISAYQKLGAPFGLVSFHIHNLDELLTKTQFDSLDSLLHKLCVRFNERFADHRAVCMRFHRNEIAMLMSCLADRAAFREKLNSAFVMFKDICREKCPDLFIHFSAGGVIVCNDEMDAHEVLIQVEQCLEKAERNGQNSLVIES